MKVILLFILIAIIGIFIYFKLQVSGDSNSDFNQTTRFSLGKHPFMRKILGLHNYGDARAEYLLNQGPIAVSWFKPFSQEVDQGVLQKFADEVFKQTGRRVNLAFAGTVKEATYSISDLESEKLAAYVKKPQGTPFTVFFLLDYKPKGEKELSSTYGESSIVISLEAHRKFVNNNQQELKTYLLSSLLHEFGHQIGLEHNDKSGCIMKTHAGIASSPVSIFGQASPEHYCELEQQQIKQIKLGL